jgi:hypothetical protein
MPMLKLEEIWLWNVVREESVTEICIDDQSCNSIMSDSSNGTDLREFLENKTKVTFIPREIILITVSPWSHIFFFTIIQPALSSLVEHLLQREEVEAMIAECNRYFDAMEYCRDEIDFMTDYISETNLTEDSAGKITSVSPK